MGPNPTQVPAIVGAGNGMYAETGAAIDSPCAHLSGTWE